jgi:diguanylate cyclase (GGDEF)-like protein
MFSLSRVMSRAEVPGGHALRFLFVVLVFWSSAQFLGTVLVNESAKLLAAQLSYVGIALTPVAWFLFALTYSQRKLHMSRSAINVISIIPAATIILAITNAHHGLIWSRWRFMNVDGYVGLITEEGFWAYVHAVYSYGLILVGSTVLTFALVQFKQHHSALLAAVFAPFIGVLANLFSLSPFNPSPWFDITTLGFLAGVMILDRGILQHGLLNQQPVMRDQVVEQLTDPVLVVTNDGTIIDTNQSALQAWTHLDNILNRNIADLVRKLPKEAILNPEKNTEVTIGDTAYEIATTLLDSSNPQPDVALVFRDVTARRKAERELREVKNELERFAHTDALTGMFNRRYFMQRLNEEFERVRRHGSVLSVLIFDLDHFKRVNDTYGHDLGDAVLIAVAEVANRIKRVTDIAARLGGEEFALLLPETGKEGALNLAHRLRKGIEIYPYAAKLDRPMQVTASVGVATVSQASREMESVLKVADRALYRAKNGGRNMVCFDDSGMV